MEGQSGGSDKKSSFLTHLLKCKFSANCSQIQEHKYFQGNVGTEIPILTRDQCSVKCLLKHTCVFYNHRIDNVACQLLTSSLVNMVYQNEWRFVSTNNSKE